MESLSHTFYFDQQARGCEIIHLFTGRLSHCGKWFNCRAAVVGIRSNVAVYMILLLHVPTIVIRFGCSTHSSFLPCAPSTAMQQVVLTFVGCMRPSRTFHTKIVRNNISMVFSTIHSAIFMPFLFRCHTRTK